MLKRLRGSRRLWQVGRTLLRYRLDVLLEGTPLERRLALLRPLAPRVSADQPRGVRLRLALQELGPIFVKFGQILSTRRDLVPPDIAQELALLQDQVAPFDAGIARAQIETALGAPVDSLFAGFDDTPLASASIAQVHAATLEGGREVVIKVLRPGIHARIDGDIALLRTLAGLVQRHHPRAH
ncbi:MAG: AarF/UbiB family protein, partial [Lysobacteraceae bacterium]